MLSLRESQAVRKREVKNTTSRDKGGQKKKAAFWEMMERYWQRLVEMQTDIYGFTVNAVEVVRKLKTTPSLKLQNLFLQEYLMTKTNEKK